MEPLARRLPAEVRLLLLAAMGADGDEAFGAILDGRVAWEDVIALAQRDRANAALWARISSSTSCVA